MADTTPNRGYRYPEYPDPQSLRQAIEDLATDVDADMAAISASLTNALEAPTVSLSRSSNQAVPSGTPTLIDWTDEVYDNDALFDPIAPTVITFSTVGIYWLTCTVGIAATADATVRDAIVEFISDGISTPIPTAKSLSLDQQSATYFSLMVPHIVIAGGEDVSVRVTHDAVGSLNAFNCRLNVTRFARLLPL